MFQSDSPIFLKEVGGHRFQRIPPTERNGRVQTSTITVSVIPYDKDFKIDLSDVEFIPTKGSGPGGQHRNKNFTAIIARHKSGLVVKAQSCKSQLQNKELALNILKAKLSQIKTNQLSIDKNNLRRAQIGSGERGDKRRTIRVQDGTVKDVDGRTWNWSDYKEGIWQM